MTDRMKAWSTVALFFLMALGGLFLVTTLDAADRRVARLATSPTIDPAELEVQFCAVHVLASLTGNSEKLAEVDRLAAHFEAKGGDPVFAKMTLVAEAYDWCVMLQGVCADGGP